MQFPAPVLTITNFAHKAAVEADDGVSARIVLATCDVPAERRRAAALDRTHHLQLVEADVPAVGVTPSGSVVAEDVRDLHGCTRHGARRYFADRRFSLPVLRGAFRLP